MFINNNTFLSKRQVLLSKNIIDNEDLVTKSILNTCFLKKWKHIIT